MLNKVLKIVLLVLILTLVGINSCLAFEGFFPYEGVYVFEENSGDVLYALNENEQFPPASTIKLMTSIIMLENVPDLDQVVICGQEVDDYGWADSEAGLWEGQEMTYRQLLNAMLIPSGNDAAGVIAVNVGRILLNDPNADRHLAQQAFVDAMNQKAEDLGMTNSHFTNPSGRGEEGQSSTPKDFSLVVAEAFKHPEIQETTMTVKYPITSIKGITYDLYNTDPILTGGPGSPYYTALLSGGKTGTTEEDKRTFVFYSTIGDAKIVGVIFNHDNEGIFGQAKNIMEEVNANYVLSTLDPNSLAGSIPVENTSLFSKNVLNFGSALPVYSMSLPEDINNYTTEVRWNPNYFETDAEQLVLKNDIDQGEKVGAVVVSRNDQIFKTVPVYAQQSLTVNNQTNNTMVVCGILLGIIGLQFVALAIVSFIRGAHRKRKRAKQRMAF